MRSKVGIFEICPLCGAHLDCGERCDCQEQKEEEKKKKPCTGRENHTGQA